MTGLVWQSIRSAPRDGTAILAYWAYTTMHPDLAVFGVVAYLIDGDDGPSWYEGSDPVGEPTHWCLLPERPA